MVQRHVQIPDDSMFEYIFGYICGYIFGYIFGYTFGYNFGCNFGYNFRDYRSLPPFMKTGAYCCKWKLAKVEIIVTTALTKKKQIDNNKRESSKHQYGKQKSWRPPFSVLRSGARACDIIDCVSTDDISVAPQLL